MSGHLALLLTACGSASQPNWYFEVRYRTPRGMGRDFTPVNDIDRTVAVILKQGKCSDTFVGVAPRVRRSGKAEDVGHVHVLWVDLDTPEAVAAADSFPMPPSILVNSGNGQHRYWVLDGPHDPTEAVRANRRLAHHLGGDLNCTDSARVMRAPGTFNFKDPENPKPVTVERVNLETYSLDTLVGHLPDPPDGRTLCPPAPRAHAAHTGHDDDPLLLVTPPEYVEAFTGQQVGRDGKITCPFHDDRTPSLHVYAEPEQGWTCFGCQRSGSIYDFCGHLWNMDTRGKDFVALRKRIATELLKAVR